MIYVPPSGNISRIASSGRASICPRSSGGMLETSCTSSVCSAAMPRRLADEGASQDPAGRSRDAQRHRTLRRLLARLYAAFGAEIANDRFAIDAFLQRLDVATDAGHRIDVRDRCVGPFVFANFSANRRRDRQGQIRRKLAHDFFDNPLVSIVAIGVKKADSDPLDVQREDLSDDLLHLRAVDRVDDGARRAQPFVDLEATIAGNQRRGLSPGQIIRERAGRPHDLEDVPESLGRYQGDSCAVALDDEVGDDRRAVDKCADVRQGDPCLIERLHESLFGRIGHGGGFRAHDRAGLLVEDDDVRKRAPDVDADTLHRADPRAAARRA